MRPRVIPVLLLRGDGLVKGVAFRKHVYVGDPINAVKIFDEKEVDELVFLDIAATQEDRGPGLELIQKIADECYMPFAVGGGIRTLAQIREIIYAGAEKVVINTAAIENPDLIVQASEHFGSQAVIVSIDVKRRRWRGGYQVMSHSGRRSTGLDAAAWARSAQQLGAGEILLTAIDRDGTRDGYDHELISELAAATTVPLIACGGAGDVAHLVQAVEQAGAAAAAAGSLFVFHGRRRAVLINHPPQDELDDAFGRGR